MNGRKQVEAYAQLWQPDSLAGHKVGDLVRLPNVPAAMRIKRLADPLLILEGPGGREIKAGWRTVERVRVRRK